MLVVSISRKDDFVGVNIVFGGRSDVTSFSDAGAQAAEHNQAGETQTAGSRELIGEKERAPQRDSGINQAKQHSRANQPEPRHEQNRKQERSAKRAEVVKSQDMRDDVAKMIAILNNAHQQWDFESYENAHHYDQRVKNQLETLGKRERQHQQRGGKSTDHT